MGVMLDVPVMCGMSIKKKEMAKKDDEWIESTVFSKDSVCVQTR